MQVSGLSVSNFTVGLTDVDLDVVFSVILVSVVVDSRRMLVLGLSAKPVVVGGVDMSSDMFILCMNGVSVFSVTILCMYGVSVSEVKGASGLGAGLTVFTVVI